MKITKSQSCLKEFIQYAALNVLGMLGISCYILADTVFISKGVGADGLTALNLAIPVYSVVHGCGMMLGMGSATKYSILKGQKDTERGSRLFTGTVYTTLLLASVFMLLGIFASGMLAGLMGADSLKGQKDTERGSRLFTGTVYTTLLLASVFMLLGIFASGMLAGLMGADSAVYDMTNTYIKVILLFAAGFMMNDVLICFVRNDGNPGLSMLAMIGGSLFNIVFDYLFIFPMLFAAGFMMNDVLICFVRNDGNPGLSMLAMIGGSLFNIVFDYLFIFPMGMGILGAVLATGVSPIVSMMILSLHFWKKKNSFRLETGRPDFGTTGQSALLGVPALIAELSSGIVIMVFNGIILKLEGNVGVAAYGVIANLSLVVISVYTGISQGMQPLISTAYGKNDKKTPGKVLRYGILTVLVFSLLIYAGIFGFAGQITAIFNSEGSRQLAQIAVPGLRVYFAGIVFAGFNIILAIYFSSMEKAVPAQVISFGRGLILMIPMAFLLSALWGITGVWLTFPVTEAIVSLIGIFLQLFIGKNYLYSRNAK